MSKQSIEVEGKPLFYIKDLRDNSIWEIHSIDQNTTNRVGWLNGVCVDVGDDENNVIGGEIGIDVEYAFNEKRHDISKTLSRLQKK